MFRHSGLRLILLVSLFSASALWFTRVYFSFSVLNPHCLNYHPAFNNLHLGKADCFDSSTGLCFVFPVLRSPAILSYLVESVSLVFILKSFSKF